jgi:hypothetical protein
MVDGLGFRVYFVHGLWFRVYGLGFRIGVLELNTQGLGFRIQVLGFSK